MDRIIASNKSLECLEPDEFEEFKDTREPYLLVAVKECGNGVILESHSGVIEWLRDAVDHEDFFEAYGGPPAEIGVYEWRGKVNVTRSFEGEYDYYLTGEWTTIWSQSKLCEKCDGLKEDTKYPLCDNCVLLLQDELKTVSNNPTDIIVEGITGTVEK